MLSKPDSTGPHPCLAQPLLTNGLRVLGRGRGARSRVKNKRPGLQLLEHTGFYTPEINSQLLDLTPWFTSQLKRRPLSQVCGKKWMWKKLEEKPWEGRMRAQGRGGMEGKSCMAEIARLPLADGDTF